jgi:hypothetical protein
MSQKFLAALIIPVCLWRKRVFSELPNPTRHGKMFVYGNTEWIGCLGRPTKAGQGHNETWQRRV